MDHTRPQGAITPGHTIDPNARHLHGVHWDLFDFVLHFFDSFNFNDI